MLLPENIIVQLIVAFIFGFAVDFSDLLDEHGLRWFHLADIVFGVIWGITGAILIILYPPIVTFIFGLLLYWFIKKKIDYPNHKIAALIIILTTAWCIYTYGINIILLAIYLLSYLFISEINSLLKEKFGNKKIFLIRHFIPTFILYLITGDIVFLLVNLATMIGTHISGGCFIWFEKNRNSVFFRSIGLSIK